MWLSERIIQKTATLFDVDQMSVCGQHKALPIERNRMAKALRTPQEKRPPRTRPPAHKALRQTAARPTPGP